MSRKLLGDHALVLSRLRQAVASQSTLSEPFNNETDFGKFKKIVQDGRRLLPERYHQPYVNVLEVALALAEKSARRGGAAARARVLRQLEQVFGTLAQPIIQLADSAQADRLKAFQALTSNLYRRFMDDSRVQAEVRKTVKWPEIDPLAFFAKGESEPFTLPASADLPVALIAKPANHAGFVPLWVIDAHEVGGHVVHDGVVGFESEINAFVAAAIKSAYETGSIDKLSTSGSIEKSIKVRIGSLLSVGRWRAVSAESFMLSVFARWLPELLADAAGVLNMGPMYANGGMLVLQGHNPTGRSANTAVFRPGKGADSHPADVVRGLFAIEMVERLPMDQAALYGKALRERLAALVGGSLPEKVVFQDGYSITYAEVKLNDLRAVLSVVADAMCKMPLKTLGDRTLTDLMTWGNKDEATANKVARLLPRGHDFDDLLEARHVVSAAVLAVEQAALSPSSSSSSSGFARTVQRIHDNSILLLKSLYEEQCLLCAVPDYGETRRKDLIRLADLARLVKRMRAN
jgi:hypothetical protein